MTRIRTALYALLALTVFLLVGVAWADEVKTFTWDNPTQRVDGSTISAGELLEYDIRCANVDGGPYLSVDQDSLGNPPLTSAGVSFAPGDYYCVARVSNAAGWSDDSPQVFFTIALPRPNPPQNLAVD